MQQRSPSLPGWSAFLTPQRCEVCGRSVVPSSADWADQWSNLFPGTLMDSWNRLWSGMVDSWMQAVPGMQSGQWPGMPSAWPWGSQAGPRAHGRDCGCGECSKDDCHCRCCVTNADLVVHARVGERRVVPLVLENNLRREREVELQLSDWTTRGGQPTQVTGQLMEPASFTLKACEERAVVLTLMVSGQQTTQNAAPAGTDASGTGAVGNNASGSKETGHETVGDIQAVATRIGLGDVDECQVYYADLRVKGCDIRPIRIAVALLPRDCAAYRIDCRCSCC